MIFVDQHPGGAPDPAAVIGEVVIERQTEIVIAAAAPFLGVPHPPPGENLAGDVGIELPLLLFLVFFSFTVSALKATASLCLSEFLFQWVAFVYDAVTAMTGCLASLTMVSDTMTMMKKQIEKLRRKSTACH